MVASDFNVEQQARMTETEESKLVDQAIQGDREALVQLLEQHGPATRRVITGKIDARWRSVLDEDDIMQQTYTDAFMGIRRFRPEGPESFARWLATLARHNLLDATKHLRAVKTGGNARQVVPSSEESCQRLWEQVSCSISTPSVKVARKETERMLADAIAQLPPAYVQVVTQYDLQGRPVEEIAASLGCSVGAIYMRRSRAHQLLSELLSDASLSRTGKLG